MAPPAQFVPKLMSDLFEWMSLNQNVVHPLVMDAVFHYEFVFIHPFSDGNGRMARLWYTAILAQWNPLFTFIPIESQIEKFQDDYYEAIPKCRGVGNSDIFIEFMLEEIDQCLKELASQATSADEQLNDPVKKCLTLWNLACPILPGQSWKIYL
ncbi:Fic family protein [Eubacterium aggregans]|uniref:Fic family protein n=1 Tax=Eubacterium aggregans TaxID=81409 RepID=UPI003F413147